MSDDTSPVAVTARLVAAYASNNRLMPQDLPGLIQAVHSALLSLSNGGMDGGGGDPQKPAVSIKKSVTGDYIICLEDGLKFKSLKRHLRSSYKMTPEDYRSKWGLPHDYPMVAPNYAAHRSRLAKQIGLGRKRPARRK
jgi:predicted transcriptional regulator